MAVVQLVRNNAAARHLQTDRLRARYHDVRQQTERLCDPLEVEDFVVQSMDDVSPTKWHLAHTSWFFETFVLARVLDDYGSPDPQYAVLFNSYYNTVGPQHRRPRRGVLSRPTVPEVMAYRGHVDRLMEQVFERDDFDEEVRNLIDVGLHHEQQHQELMLMDIKHVFWSNPLRPAYLDRTEVADPPEDDPAAPLDWIEIPAGLRWMGHRSESFAFDNELPRHQSFVAGTRLASRLVTCEEYLEFIEDDGYRRAELWLSDGWDAVQREGWTCPLYWQKRSGGWEVMTLAGVKPLCAAEPVSHVSFYEADAFARWTGASLPSEQQWETAAEALPLEGNFAESGILHPLPATAAATDSGEKRVPRQMLGDLWEWTASPYVCYPGYQAPAGALAEYNSKFACNQMVLRGGCAVTPRSHMRHTYRNFYGPACRWPFTGIRLAKPA